MLTVEWRQPAAGILRCFVEAGGRTRLAKTAGGWMFELKDRFVMLDLRIRKEFLERQHRTDGNIFGGHAFDQLLRGVFADLVHQKLAQDGAIVGVIAPFDRPETWVVGPLRMPEGSKETVELTVRGREVHQMTIGRFP